MLELFSSENSQCVITNNTKNLIYEPPFFSSHNLKYVTKYREKKRFKKTSEWLIEEISISLDFNGLFTDTRIITWLGDSLTVNIYYFNDEINIPTTIYKAKIENPTINGNENDLLKISFQLSGNIANT